MAQASSIKECYVAKRIYTILKVTYREHTACHVRFFIQTNQRQGFRHVRRSRCCFVRLRWASSVEVIGLY